MPRPSRIDRLPEDVREVIAGLRREGRTIDEILAKLRELELPDMPSRTGMGRHMREIDRQVERIKSFDLVAQRLMDNVGEGGNARGILYLSRNLQRLMATHIDQADGEGGEALTLKDLRSMSATLSSISLADMRALEGRGRGRKEERTVEAERTAEASRPLYDLPFNERGTPPDDGDGPADNEDDNEGSG